VKVDFKKLDRAFNPRVVAVIGDKKETNYMWLRGQKDFKGKLYSVQIDPREVEGIRALGIDNRTSLMDIQEPVDFAIVAVPRSAALRVLADLISKDVGAAHFFTAGFSETDTEDGREAERKLTEMARAANFHLVGPNCMGIFSPKVGIRNAEVSYNTVGPVGFISQSGNHAVNFIQEAHIQGLDINKAVSFGNGIVLDSADYLDYFATDPDIKVIGMYIEGVKDGPGFVKSLKAAAVKKPVVIWKGGRTEEGVRAIGSHTGSLAIPQAVWASAVRQCQAVQVSRMEELIDTLKALLYLKPVTGSRVAAVGGSGGGSVAVADAFAEAGLTLPPFSRESYSEFASFWINIGGGYKNPVDTYNANRREMRRILDILERDANTDNIALLFFARPAGPAGGPPVDAQLEPMRDMRDRTDKPVMAVVSSASDSRSIEAANNLMMKLQEMGIPSFPGMERGGLALKNAVDYYRMKKGGDTGAGLG
jgi:acyl-CoA synthetase (NDP forming)